MKKYIAPDVEMIVLLSAEDCLVTSANYGTKMDDLDFGEDW